jgi:hypothetical protein
MNMELVTLGLDAEVPDTAADGDDGWLREAANGEELIGDDLPRGPGDTPVSDESLALAGELVATIAGDIGLGK